ncbi:hypothetical protein TRP8649_02038 [Pelagimonas phthalicica]|uniref:HupE / UreJ protein n=1 Tax=Pelagimonas phthalicica TaxID=1037362 RepID=A0A238JDK2_9RHOB|nr:hypothetical protein [Pelagimonas phthalicica]TDS93553.1 hypothetical protein CLV87_0036 [Pelagimonas phthalicica]SMX27926.1 hypothetical protein TRP8649_02038 [Pelagimonas phthalicica]
MKHAIIALLLSANAAAAHQGHEAAIVEGDSHWLTQGDHLVIVALAAIASAMAARRLVSAWRGARQKA